MCNNHDQDFVHIHLHTEYSLLDGFAQIKRAVSRAKELNMQSLAITDHGTMFGVMDFYRACKAAEIKPLIGVESYLARRGMQDRDPQLDRQPYHMLLLARNEAGYKNLLKIASASQLDGYYYRPRIDKEFLAAHAEGIVATSGCLAAEIPRMVENGQEDEARKTIGWYQDVFGKENFFLELQQHDIPELVKLNKWLLANKDFADVPLVATNDVHYVNLEDHDVHDTLLCIQTSELKRNKKRMMMTDPSYHMRSQEEMWRIFGEVAPDALRNTLLIAEMCNIHNLDDQNYHLPIFPVPPQFDNPEQYLRYLCEKGVEWRYGLRTYDEDVQHRLHHELNIIFEMGFATYFLIVWDLVQFARSADIWWNVRGSGAGSLVAYSLGITSLDPLENALIFERFLNPHRKTMPDFDLDFPEDRRQEMIEYCARKYGEDKVAAIITFGTMKPKAAIRDVGRALDMPLPEVNRLAKLVPTVPKPPSVKQLLGKDSAHLDDANAELIEIYKKDKYAKQLLDYAAQVEGTPRHAGTHAAGIIVADKPLVEYLPLHRPTSGTVEDAPVKQVTQFPMETAESIGLLKIDFLGLSTLTIMRRACELIEKHHGIRYDMSNIPFKPDPDDPEITRMVEETFEMLGRGESIGVFQVEGSGMRQMLVGMRPKTFEHIIAAISLYRPGPMQFIPLFNDRMHELVEIEYLHPKLEPIISNTYGIITYQEQIMQIAMELFGYDAGEADLMRRAVSKKKEKDLMTHRSIFMERGPERGVDAQAASDIFEQIEFFANYGFNKSHAADYAVITCQTAFLKCHYPHEYMTALMSVHRSDTDKIGVFVADAKRLNIDILPPHINYSFSDFDIETHDDGSRHVRFGMAAIKNLGLGPVSTIIEERARRGIFKDLDDFLDRCSASEIGKRGLEALIRVGAMDEFGDRPTLLHNIDKLVKHSTQRHKAASVGQVSLFDLLGDSGGENAASIVYSLETPPNPADKREQLRWEKDLVGMYVTDHPLKMIMGKLDKIITHTTLDLQENAATYHGASVTIAGLITDIRNIVTKRGDAMAILQVEDIQNKIECVMFPETWARYRELIEEDKVLIIRGKAEDRQGEMQIIVTDITSDFQVAYSDNDTSLEELRNARFDWLQPNSSGDENPFYAVPPVEIIDEDEDPEDYRAASAFREQLPLDEDLEGDIEEDEVDQFNLLDIEDDERDDEEVEVYSAHVVEEIVEDQDYIESISSPDDELESEDEFDDVISDEEETSTFAVAFDADDYSFFDRGTPEPDDDWIPVDDGYGHDESNFIAPPASKSQNGKRPQVTNGHGSTQSNGNGGHTDGHKAPSNGKSIPSDSGSRVDESGRLIPPPASAAVPRKVTSTRRKLVINFVRSGDDDADYRLLRWIYSKALSFPGSDELSVFATNPHNNEKFKIDFPDLTINVIDTLVNDLKERLGTMSVEVLHI